MRTFFAALFVILLASPFVHAAQTIGSVARVKGQEPTMIHGYGIVTGLKGTGDKPGDFRETARMLEGMLRLSGRADIESKDLFASKNVALVYVSATIPGAGARDGETIDCTVAAMGSCSSLKDGQLMLCDLIGPIPQAPEQTMILAKSWGLLTIDKMETPTVAKVVNGARLTAEFRNPYIRNGCFTLVLPEKHASWAMSQAIAEIINETREGGGMGGFTQVAALDEDPVAKPLDQNSIVVKIPYSDLNNPVAYINEILSTTLENVERIPKVVINARAGVITIDPNVEIAPIAVSHKNNISVQAGGAPAAGAEEPAPPNRWVPFDVEERMGGEQNVKLKALCDALNAMKVPTEDIIEIIRSIDAQGKLVGQIVDR